jgi:predicted RNA methylase
MPITLTERTLYSPLSEYLKKEIGAKTVSEVGEAKYRKNYLDIFFQLNDSSFIAEIKLGKEEKKFTEAIAQITDYGFKYGITNVIALVFPYVKSGQIITNIEEFEKELILQKVRGWIRTDYLTIWVDEWEFKEVFKQLKEAFESKKRHIDFNSIVKAIRELVQDLFEVIKQVKTGIIFEEVVQKLELFVGLGEIKDKKQAEYQISMLSSYLLFNQLLFYHIYKVKTKDSKLPELKPVNTLKEIQEYFKKIAAIDYDPIYDIHLIDKIPENKETLSLINNTIKNLLTLRAEYITQDLAGRFFHALLPKEVAKVWAAFYTNPIAAEILANLSIDKWNETVIDPACGSGTLLSAAYRRKLELYKEQTNEELNEETLKKLHKKFVEEDITGIDIMPFAAHLSAINLSLQRLEQATDKVRIARADSLELASKFHLPEFKKEGVLLKSFSEIIQTALSFFKEKVTKSKIEPISFYKKRKEFYLKPVDVVIMNPPFSDREKLPKDYREKLSEKTEFGEILGKICGHRINLWGYFLALADLILKPNGKIAAVLPINIARGKATEKIRNYLLENYYIKYVVKATKDLAFSESAAFRDILLIAEKKKPKDSDLTTIIFLKKPIRELSFYKMKEIINSILSNIEQTEDYEIQKIPTFQFLVNKNNLMKFIRGVSIERNKVILEFLEKIEINSRGRLISLTSKEMLEGFHASPAGLSQLVFIINPIDKSRTKKNVLLILNKIEDDFVKAECLQLKKEFKIEKYKVVPAIKTLTGIKTMNITSSHDFLIIDNFKNFQDLIHLSKWKGKFDWNEVKKRMEGKATHVAILHRINIFSKNTYFISCFSENLFYTTHAFNIFPNKSKEESRFLCLFFNSVVGILQILTLMKETTGEYIEFMQTDLEEFKVLKFETISQTEKEFTNMIWDKISNIEFPSILEQFQKRFWARVELDKTILRLLGFSDEEIEYWLPKVYNVIVEELI